MKPAFCICLHIKSYLTERTFLSKDNASRHCLRDFSNFLRILDSFIISHETGQIKLYENLIFMKLVKHIRFFKEIQIFSLFMLYSKWFGWGKPKHLNANRADLALTVSKIHCMDHLSKQCSRKRNHHLNLHKFAVVRICILYIINCQWCYISSILSLCSFKLENT